MSSILVVTEEKIAGEVINWSLKTENSIKIITDNKEKVISKLKKKRYDVLFIDIDTLLEDTEITGLASYKEALKSFWQVWPSLEVVVIAGRHRIRQAVNIVKAGAATYLNYPVAPEEVHLVMEIIQESSQKQMELDYFRDQFWKSEDKDLIRTNSPKVMEVLNKIRSVALTNATVLLTGETGTGKSLMAQLIHRHSNRSDSPFIPVHCGAIPDSLLESELFGHEKGAFTGADRRKPGKFEIAQEGTILLDEVGTISTAMQIKLLQVLHEKLFSRVGGETIMEVDVRIIAATNDDLELRKDEGSFRSDLYYRLNVFPIEIPPLRERLEDLPIMVETFLNRLNDLYKKNIIGLHPTVSEALTAYDWPGNIRELENLIERAYILEQSTHLTPESFPSNLIKFDYPHAEIPLNTSNTLAEVRRLAVEKVEKQYLNQILTENDGRMNKTAETAGISSRQLHKLMTKYELKKEKYKPVKL